MKELVTVFAACAIAGAALAVDSNVVGYQTTGLDATVFKMVGVQFSDIGADTGLTLDKLLTGNFPYGTQIQVLKSSGSGYDTYTYLEEAYDGVLDDFVPGWADIQDDLATVTLVTGQAFWLKAPSVSAASLAGEVLATDKAVNVSATLFNMIANPYPVATSLNETSWTGLTYGDQIQVLKSSGSGYDTYTYLEEAFDSVLDDFVPGWADIQDDMVTLPIPSGQGFWINTATAVTVNFVTPL